MVASLQCTVSPAALLWPPPPPQGCAAIHSDMAGWYGPHTLHIAYRLSTPYLPVPGAGTVPDKARSDCRAPGAGRADSGAHLARRPPPARPPRPSHPLSRHVGRAVLGGRAGLTPGAPGGGGPDGRARGGKPGGGRGCGSTDAGRRIGRRVQQPGGVPAGGARPALLCSLQAAQPRQVGRRSGLARRSGLQSVPLTHAHACRCSAY